MRAAIPFFVKIFNDESHANSFLDGKLFMNRLSYFTKLESDIENKRSDKYEGVYSWHQIDRVEWKINDFVIKPLEPVIIRTNYHKNLNVFCLFATRIDNFVSISDEILEGLNQQLGLLKNIQGLGEHAVIVTNPNELIDRVAKSAIENNYSINWNFVDYYDPIVFHGEFSAEDVPFKKRLEFKHQQEFRFVVNTGTVGDLPICLDTSCIRDIASYCKTKDLIGSKASRENAI